MWQLRRGWSDTPWTVANTPQRNLQQAQLQQPGCWLSPEQASWCLHRMEQQGAQTSHALGHTSSKQHSKSSSKHTQSTLRKMLNKSWTTESLALVQLQECLFTRGDLQQCPSHPTTSKLAARTRVVALPGRLGPRTNQLKALNSKDPAVHQTRTSSHPQPALQQLAYCAPAHPVLCTARSTAWLRPLPYARCTAQERPFSVSQAHSLPLSSFTMALALTTLQMGALSQGTTGAPLLSL